MLAARFAVGDAPHSQQTEIEPTSLPDFCFLFGFFCVFSSRQAIRKRLKRERSLPLDAQRIWQANLAQPAENARAEPLLRRIARLCV
jgi:hypothetical protein